MSRKRTVHEVAFRLSHDMALQITPRMGELGSGLASQQLRTLRLIWSGDHATLVDVAKTLKRDKAQVTRLIDELCKAGLVERKPNPNDGRSKILALTPKAYTFFERVETIEDEFANELIDGIDPKDLDTFFKVSDQLSRNLREISADKD
ncbi:MarR family winged helix-turn-helix transcriptional regulator [Pseudoteredinibacter isoporae]|uniref:MarR family winged helix-turn-helix transcriptional regulator n=1 Tax=Pseudoteredinibacter isoporae TaxID=570281 RepID=UPI0031022A06